MSRNQFKKGPIPMLEVVGYADYALEQFFAEASKQPWFNNTLFILTADHPRSSAARTCFYQGAGGRACYGCWYTNRTDNLKAPAIWWCNKRILCLRCSIMSVTKENTWQLWQRYFDSTPSAMHLIITPPITWSWTKIFALQFNGGGTTGLYDYKSDSSLINNVMNEYRMSPKNGRENWRPLYRKHITGPWSTIN